MPPAIGRIWLVVSNAWLEICNLLTDGNARDSQVAARAEIALHEHADRVPSLCGRQLSRRGTDAALEAEARHASAAADHAFLWQTAGRGVEGAQRVVLSHVEAVDVIQASVVRLGDD